MIKFLSLLLAAVLLLSCAALAEGLLAADPEEVLDFDRESYVED